VLLLLLASRPGFGQILDQNLWVTNGPVLAVAYDAGTVYLGGDFTQVGPPGGGAMVTRNHLAALDAATGTPTPWNPDADSAVTAVAVREGIREACAAPDSPTPEPETSASVGSQACCIDAR